MRIELLNLTAFGCFTDVELDLSSPGLHIVYGPNEAGKTTALEAVDNLLFDIPMRTTYDFVHTKDKLELAARIVGDDDLVLNVVRRKRRNDPLVEMGSDRSIAENEWSRVLGGLSRSDFAALFSLGGEQLKEGTAQLLGRAGRAGETLFAAGMGIVQLGSVLKKLNEEGKALFAPTGRATTVNKALTQYKVQLRAVKELSIKPASFDHTDKAHEKAQARRVELEADRKRLDADSDRLLVLALVLPRIVDRAESLAKMGQLRTEGVVGSPTWVDRVNGATADKERLVGEKATAESAIATAQSVLDAIVVDAEILECGEQIDSLAEKIDNYLTGVGDREHRAEERVDAERSAIAALSAITGGLASVADFQSAAAPIAATAKARSIRDRWVRAEAHHETVLGTTQSLQDDLDQADEELALIPKEADPSALQVVLDSVSSEGDPDAAMEAARRVLIEATELRNTLAGQLELADNEIARAVASPAPGSEEVEEILAHLMAKDADVRAAADRVRQSAGRIEEGEAALQIIAQGSDLPNVGDLSERREERDSLWVKIRSSWLESGTGLEPTEAHADSFENAAADADSIADRLWGEAKETAERAQLLKEGESARAENATASAEEIDARNDGEQSYGTWRKRWPNQGIPTPPASLRGWEKKMVRLVELHHRVEASHVAHRALARRIAAHRRRLTRALEDVGQSPVSGPEIAPLAAQVKTRLEEIRKAAADRKGLVDRKTRVATKQPKAEADTATAAAAVGQAKREFCETLGTMAVDVDSPDSAASLLSRLEQLGKLIEERDSLARRIAGIDQRSVAFEDALAAVLAKVPGIDPTPPEVAARRLVARLLDARESEAKRQTSQGALDDATEILELAEGLLRACDATRVALCEEVSLDDVSELDSTAQRSTQVAALASAVGDLEAEILRQGRGRLVVELATDVEGTDADSLEQQIEETKTLLEEVSEELSEVIGLQTGLAHQLNAMDTSAAAAMAAEEANSTWAVITEGTERFIRLVLAEQLAAEAIRRYSDAHQDELLEAAGEYFGRLTLGGYSGIVVNGATGEELVLSARTVDGVEKEMSQLSAGTRDELYFALRLASLEKSIERYGPKPCLLDDVLVQFDDERASVALGALSELAGSTQVLLFTHHHHVLELAAGALKADSWVAHELGGARVA